jgi:pimeloyl-ACP methyl ester carboxylesterase
VGRRLLLVASLAAALFAPAQARAAIPLASCGASGVQCGTVVVPLDRRGTTAGTISLHVEVLPAQGFERGVIFLVAGGPGQPSSGSFDLADSGSAEYMRTIFPNYRLVAFDNRGTGKSGVIDCPALQRSTGLEIEQERVLVRECANLIGPTREFYATRDHAEDIEAVRTALGLARIGLYGVSYGTKLSLAYALAHPAAVDRLILDSVVPSTYPDPLERPVLREMGSTLNQYCAGGRCRGATSNYAADVAVVANRLEAKPVRGAIIGTNGRSKTVRMNGEDLLGLIIDSDLNPGLAAELPAAVHAARGGYLRPLLRLFDYDQRASLFPSDDLSFGLNVATNCADGRFPWSPDTPVPARTALWEAAVAAEPASSFGLFGKWAARMGTASECLEWPSPAGNAPLGGGPLPNVPVLVLNGGYDLRTPVANAVAVARLFPQGHLVVVPGVGHSVVGADLSFCALRVVREWLLGRSLPAAAQCPRVKPPVKILTAFPRSARRTAAATVALAAKTVREAEAAWAQAVFSGGDVAPAGLFGGRVAATPTGLRATRYSLVTGVRITGRITAKFAIPAFSFSGTVRVDGPRAVAGTLRVTNAKVSGTLGGRRVSAGV